MAKPCSRSYFSRSRWSKMALSSSCKSSVMVRMSSASKFGLTSSSLISRTLDSSISALLFLTLSRLSRSTRSIEKAMDSASFFRAWTACCSASAAAVARASSTFCTTSWGASVDAPEMVTVCSFCVSWSLAETVRMPLLSTSKVTSIFRTPAGAGGRLCITNTPSSLFLLANLRSPCTTSTFTLAWLSLYVEYTFVFFIGILVLRGMKTEQRPSCVATLRDSGITSSRTRFRTSPVRTPAWMAAPTATTSSGFTLWFGVRPPLSFVARACTAGMRVEPPTRTTSFRSLGLSSASPSACSTGPLQRSTRSAQRLSNLDRESDSSMVLGPASSAAMKGSDIMVSCITESSILAFSAASVSLCRACLSSKRGIPCMLINPSASQSTILLSKSSPPRCESPLVASTSHTPSPTTRTETSKVPPPRSKTMIVSLVFFSSP
mmetsp:Transcript_48509/g.140522  ORF Transcript_48509/g.140522 Transcript_48509/m.140522 type:complete len:435 (-) Transcript_48509:892-2196(-)